MAETEAELSGFRYRLFVDDSASDMLDVRCAQLRAEGTAACSGRLPSIGAGRHTLTLMTVSSSGVESERSSAIEVLVLRSSSSLVTSDGFYSTVGTSSAAGTAASVKSAVDEGIEPTDGLRLQTVSAGLKEPTDLAVTPDRRVLVAERRGDVRVVSNGVLQPRPAITLNDVSAGDGAGLLGLAIDPAFDKNHYVYCVYTTDRGFRVARFREAGGTLGERAILLDGVTSAAQAAAALRFGPDSKLYVSFDDSGDVSRAGDLGSFNGKVLRFNPDGSVPPDQAGLTPVYVADVSAARAFDWAPRGHFWIAEGSSEGSGVLDAVVDESRTGRRGRIAARYRLPEGQVPSSAFFYRGGLIKEWAGDLLIALLDSGQLLRLRFDPEDGTKVVTSEIVLDANAGRIRAVTGTADGLVYLANDDRLLSLTPSSVSGP
jgi:glucose/arabinose dehydrogenase